jgi:hypothetical protein
MKFLQKQNYSSFIKFSDDELDMLCMMMAAALFMLLMIPFIV